MIHAPHTGATVCVASIQSGMKIVRPPKRGRAGHEHFLLSAEAFRALRHSVVT